MSEIMLGFLAFVALASPCFCQFPYPYPYRGGTGTGSVISANNAQLGTATGSGNTITDPFGGSSSFGNGFSSGVFPSSTVVANSGSRGSSGFGGFPGGFRKKRQVMPDEMDSGMPFEEMMMDEPSDDMMMDGPPPFEMVPPNDDTILIIPDSGIGGIAVMNSPFPVNFPGSGLGITYPQRTHFPGPDDVRVSGIASSSSSSSQPNVEYPELASGGAGSSGSRTGFEVSSTK